MRGREEVRRRIKGLGAPPKLASLEGAEFEWERDDDDDGDGGEEGEEEE